MSDLPRRMLWADSGHAPLAAVVTDIQPQAWHVYSRRSGVWHVIAQCPDHKAMERWFNYRVKALPVLPVLAAWLDTEYANLIRA